MQKKSTDKKIALENAGHQRSRSAVIGKQGLGDQIYIHSQPQKACLTYFTRWLGGERISEATVFILKHFFLFLNVIFYSQQD